MTVFCHAGKTYNRVPLVWHGPFKPNEECRYDHVWTDTVFGRYYIEWKSWKDYADFCPNFVDVMISTDGNDIYSRVGDVYYAGTVEEAMLISEEAIFWYAIEKMFKVEEPS